MKKLLLPIVGIMAVATTGCGGSGGGGGAALPTTTAPGAPSTGYPVAPPPGTTVTPSNHSTAKFTIKVPSGASKSAASLNRSTASVRGQSAKRSPLYVSTFTQSIQIAMTSLNGTDYTATSPVTSDLTPGSANCVAQASADSGLLCTVEFPALPVGADGFTLTTYSNTVSAGQTAGTALSTNKVSGIIQVGAVTNIPVTLAGIIGSLAVTLDQNQTVSDASWLTPGTPSSVNSLVVTAFDTAGGQIIGAEPFQVANGNLGATNGITAPDSIDVSDNDALNPNATTLQVAASTSNPATVNSGALGANLSAPNSALSYAYTGQALSDKADVVSVVDHLNSTIKASIPVRVNSAGLYLANANPTPIDALLAGASPAPVTALAFPDEHAPKNAYQISAGNDSVINATILESGWGTLSNPFMTSDNCVGENIVLGVAPNAGPTGTTATTVTISGDKTVHSASTCTMTIIGGGGDVDTFNLSLTGSANGGNFQVQSVNHKS